MTKEKTVSITIDNKKLDVKAGLTILQAARLNNIYIPSLCALEHLPSYGACRLCIVEVDGIRGFPTSCTTPVDEGMVIRTETQELKGLRQEILKLLLSEHPASCLFCSERDECKEFQGTIRKVGYTTGCRYCPNDSRCELQVITEKIGLTETSYPVYYRNFPVEKYDPFYDRDYNLCILCGRCIRVCNDIRLNGTLSFKQRGQLTTIGPAFDRTHLEAGCEFCGACVNVCPTGTLSVKTGKWYGMPDAQIKTTCNLCSLGCVLNLQIKNNAVIDSLPDYDSPIDKGLICVKGRFCITEYIHSPTRYGTPMEMTPVGYNNISWDQALNLAAEKIAHAEPGESIVIISPQLLNEDLYVAQEFARKTMGTDNILPAPLMYLSDDFVPYWNLCIQSQGLDIVEKAEAIIAIGFDSLYGYSPIGIGIKKAARNGACLITVNSKETNLDMLSHSIIQSKPAFWPGIMDALTGSTKKGSVDKKITDIFKENSTDIDEIKRIFAGAKNRLIVLGHGGLNDPARPDILARIEGVADKKSWGIIVANPFTNLMGMMLMGAFPGLKPKDIYWDNTVDGTITLKSGLMNLDLKKKRRLIYIIGDAPIDAIPETDYLIYQNAIPARFHRQPDLILPVSLFPESEGTIINMEHLVMPVKKAIEPYMESRPDWWILNGISERIKKGRLKYKDIQSIQGEIKKLIRGYPNIKKRIEFKKISISGATKTKAKKVIPVPDFHKAAYRGIALSDCVSGMKVIERSLDE
ncbi:MAG TPA: molybdopterin-dependent oxidoreductase [Syntrophorhabdaceae bacterium]|nr:molybdopterin-dependent oxidoreductase [Syntrophorhabdaceae bacterium]